MKILRVSLPILLVLMASACATKKYVRVKTGAVNDRVTQVQTQTNDQIAVLSAKEKSDVSRLDERVNTVDTQLGMTTKVAEDARASAAQANVAAQSQGGSGDTTDRAVRLGSGRSPRSR